MKKKRSLVKSFFVFLGFYFGAIRLFDASNQILAYKYTEFWINKYGISNNLLLPEIYITINITLAYTLILGTLGIMFKKSMGWLLYLISMSLYVLERLAILIFAKNLPPSKGYLIGYLMIFFMLSSIYFFTRPDIKSQFK